MIKNLTAIIALVLLVACNSNTKKLTGNWKIVNAYTRFAQTVPRNMQDEADAAAKAKYTGWQYTFTEDGTLTITAGSETIKGRYEYKDKFIKVVGEGFEEALFPAIGESIFHLTDETLLVKVLPATGDGYNVVYKLSKIK